MVNPSLKTVSAAKLKTALAIIFTLFFKVAFSQQANPPDSSTSPSKSDYVSKMQKSGNEEAVRSIQKFKTEQIALKQKHLLDEISKAAGKANIYLNTGFDTTGASNEINRIQHLTLLAGDGIFSNKGSAQTSRNLSSTSKILHELLNRANLRKKQVDKSEEDLFRFNAQIDSLSADPVLYTFSDDSLQIVDYV